MMLNFKLMIKKYEINIKNLINMLNKINKKNICLKEKCQKEWPYLPHSFSAQSKFQVMDAGKKIKSCDIASYS